MATGAAAVGLTGKEGDIFRKVIGWSIFFVLILAVFVWLQATRVLSWMVPMLWTRAVARPVIVRSESSIERGA